MLVTVSAYFMGRFGACGLWLQGVGEAALPNCFKLVALLLAVPCFKCADAFFQLAFFGNQRRLRLLGLEQQAHKFELHRLNLRRVSDVNEGLRQVKRGFGSAERAAYR